MRQRREKKGEPFSIRLNETTERYVADEARRTGRSKSAVVQELAEEAARVRRFPGIGFRGEAPRRAWLRGTALDIWEIIQAYQDLGSVEAMAAGSELTEDQIRLAVAYWQQYPDEIGQAVAENRRPLEEWVSLYPFIRIFRRD